MDKELFAANIAYYCDRKGEKPTPACINAGVGGDFLTNVKKGRAPRVSAVSDLAAYLGVTVSDLLGETSGGSERLTEADMQLLNAYHRADDRARNMVDLALEPFREKEKSSGAKVG